MNRRKFVLEGAGLVVAASLAGCGGGQDDPLSLPPAEGWGLLVGRFADADAATRMAASLRARGYLDATLVLTALDGRGRTWVCVVVGPFAELEEARDRRSTVARDLQVAPESVTVVRLPLAPLDAARSGAWSRMNA